MDDQPKILVVHHERLILTLITDQLNKTGYITRQAETGYSALTITKEFRPDLVLLDMMLPDLNGLEILDSLSKKTGDKPGIILLTGKTIEKDILSEGLELGADDFIQIPVSNRELLARVQSILRVRESRKEILESKERYQAIFETVPISIWEEDFSGLMKLFEKLKKAGTKDLDQYIQKNPGFVEKAAKSIFVKDVNQVTMTMFGGENKQEFIKSLDYFIMGSNDQFKDQLLQLWNGSNFFEQEFIHNRLDGKTIVVRVTIRYPEELDQFSNVYVLKADITDQKKVEESLRESKNRYKKIFNTVPVSIWEEDFSWVVRKFAELRQSGVTDLRQYMKDHPELSREAPGHILVKKVNPSAVQMFHAKNKKELLTSIDKYFYGSYEAFEKQLLAIWNNERFYEFEGIHKTLDGGQIIVRMTMQFPDKPEEFSSVYVLKTDITEIKAASDQQKFFYDVLSASVNEIYTFDAESLKFVFVSQGAIANLGYSMEEMRQMTPVDIKPEIGLEKFLTLLKPLAEGKQTLLEFQTVHQRANGTTYPVEVHLQRITLGEQAVYLAVILDITKRVEAIESQKASELMFQKLVEEIPAIVYLSPLPGSTMEPYISPRLTEILGYTAEETLDRENRLKMVHPDFRSKMNLIFKKAMETGEKQTHEFIGIKKDGKEIWLTETLWVVKSDEGIPMYLQGIIEDISERKKTEEELGHSRDLMKYVIENSRSSIAILDNQLCYLYVSQRFLEQFKTVRKNILGMNHYEVYPDLPQKFRDAHQRALKGKVVSSEGDRYLREDGSEIWSRWSCRPWFDAAGSIGGIILESEDITDQLRDRKALEASEQKFRLIVENAGLGVGYYDLEGRLVYLNSTAMKFMTGKLEDYVGKSLIQLYGEEAGREYTRRLQLATESEQSTHYEDKVNLPSGTKWFHSIYSRVMDSLGGITGIQIISEEITEQKEINNKIREDEEKFRMVFDTANVGKSLTLPTGEVRANQALADMLGYTVEELSQMTWQTITPLEEVETITKQIKPLLDGLQDGVRFTKRYIRKDGTLLWGDVSVAIRRDENGKPMHFITTIVDVTDRKKAEESLQQTTQLLSLFIKNSPIYAFIKRVVPGESRVLFASENYIDMIGIPGTQMVGKTMEDLFPLEYAEKFTSDDWQVVSNGETLTLEEELNGHSFITIKFPIDLGSQHLLAGYTVDVTDLKQKESKLRELTNRQEALLGTMPDILMETDLNKVYTWANPAGREFFGEDVVGHSADEFFIGKQDTYQKVETLFLGDERTIYVESWQRRKDGDERLLAWWCRVVLDADGKPVGALSTARDITESKLEEEQIRTLNAQLEQRVEERTRELRDAQEQIVRKEKLAFLGQLAGSVGHELRNPLAVIANAAYYLKMTNTSGDEKVKKYLEMIESETHDAEKIISDLLEFARTKSLERTPARVVEMVNHTLERLHIPANIKVSMELPESLPEVYVDPRHVGQILENLVTNACQAMKDGGTLKVRAYEKELKDRLFVGISVKDTGVGISKENLGKLFEPLFTTKARGIGLGLPVCKKLAEVNEGAIEVFSEEGKGAEFILYLPVKGQRE